MPSVTVPTRKTAFVGTGTVTEIVPTVVGTDFSLHDCADPGQAGAHNEIWPRGAGLGSVTYKTGVVVHSRNPLDPTATVKVSKV